MFKIRNFLSITIFLMFLALPVLACNSSAPPPSEGVNIRIRNVSSQDFSQSWLGEGKQKGATQTTWYGRVDSGETTDYEAMDPVPENYGFADIRSDGEMLLLYNISPSPYLGVSELSAGEYYTFVFDIVAGDLQLVDIIHEPAGS